MRRVLIAGTGSGCGKTTVTCALLSALIQNHNQVAAFKCGPDYIDPMFHREIIGAASCNLDSFFCGRDTIRYLLERNGKNADISVIEGVMGFYDGGAASAHAVSQITDTPVILVLDCKGMQDSLGAVMQGYLQYDIPNHINGFLFNRLPVRLIPFAKELCSKLHTEYFGCLPAQKFSIESRHLGLVTTDEIADLKSKLLALGTAAAEYIELEKILALENKPVPAYHSPQIPHLSSSPVIAVAKDRAFCFQYPENLQLLEEMGCIIKFFSPMLDDGPPDADGLILCGGYPELYADCLSQNISMLRAVREKILGGMPVIAECGGFMYLHSSLRTKDGVYSMANVISGEAYPTDRLNRFGYLTMTAVSDQLLCAAGDTLRAHEYHYWDSTSCGTGFHAAKQDGRAWDCVHTSKTMYAGFPHLYFYSDIQTAFRFVQAAKQYGEQHGTHQSDSAC